MKTIEIDIKHASDDLVARLVWQQLLNVIVEAGWPLTHIDDFLCDLKYFGNHFSRATPPIMYWAASCADDHVRTDWAAWKPNGNIVVQVATSREQRLVFLNIDV